MAKRKALCHLFHQTAQLPQSLSLRLLQFSMLFKQYKDQDYSSRSDLFREETLGLKNTSSFLFARMAAKLPFLKYLTQAEERCFPSLVAHILEVLIDPADLFRKGFEIVALGHYLAQLEALLHLAGDQYRV